jgi:hypothetical protein
VLSLILAVGGIGLPIAVPTGLPIALAAGTPSCPA